MWLSASIAVVVAFLSYQVRVWNGCPPGTHSASRLSFPRECTPCPLGTRRSVEEAHCEPCPEMTHPSHDRTACLPCPAGQYANQGDANCMLCPAGSIRGENDPVCYICPEMTAPREDRTECVPCQAGHWAPEGSGGCIPCSSGTYRSPMDFHCLPCPAGYTSPVGSVHAGDCIVTAVSTAMTAHVTKGELISAIQTGFGGIAQTLSALVDQLCRLLFDLSSADFWSRYQNDREDYSGFNKGKGEAGEACPFATQEAFSAWLLQTADFKAVQAASSCKPTKKAARRVLLRYHPDKFTHVYPKCGKDIPRAAIHSLNELIQHRCK